MVTLLHRILVVAAIAAGVNATCGIVNCPTPSSGILLIKAELKNEHVDYDTVECMYYKKQSHDDYKCSYDTTTGNLVDFDGDATEGGKLACPSGLSCGKQ